MFKFVTTRTKILIPMFLLTAILILMGGMIVFFSYSKITSLQNLDDKIIFSSKIAALLHTLQKERGLSAAYVVNKNDKYKQEMLAQRAISDCAIKKMKKKISTLSTGTSHSSVQKLLKRLEQLKAVRVEIDKHNVYYDGVIKFYSLINSSLLNILVNISKESHRPIVTQNILAYTNLLYLKENMGKERAIGVTIYSKQKVDRESLLKFSNLLALEKRNEVMFLNYASKSMKTLYNEKIKESSFLKVIDMRNTILDEKIQLSHIDSKIWFTAISNNLNTLDSIARFIEKKTITNIHKEIKSLYTVFSLLTTLIIISIIVFILMLLAFFKLAREEQRLRVVMDKYIISSTTDLTGKIIDVSEAFCTISGYTKEELIGQPHSMVRHPDMPKETFKQMWYRLNRGLSWKGKVKNKRSDGSFYWVYANVEPLFTSKGNIDSFVSIRLDITESELLHYKIQEEEKKNKWHEEMIREQSRLVQMGEMISMIAHQWRQPLSAIAAASGSLQLKAKRNRLDQDTAIEIADKIKSFSLHLSSTIDDFRNFFKTNKTKKATNFKTVLTSVLSIIEGSLEENKVIFNVTVKGNDDFQTFENELKQVILNLIKNAEDALLDNKIKNPQIDILIENSKFTIYDNAGGIPEDIIDKIFDPYFSTKTKKDGTGLGLYMSKMIIEDHCKGKIAVTNENDGAKFQITLGELNG